MKVIKSTLSIFFLVIIFFLPLFHNVIIVDNKFKHSYKITLHEDLIFISKTCHDDSYNFIYNLISDSINRQDTSELYSSIDVNSSKFAKANSVLIFSKNPILNDHSVFDNIIKTTLNNHFNSPSIQELYAECSYETHQRNEYIKKITNNSYNNNSTHNIDLIFKNILSGNLKNIDLYNLEKKMIRDDKSNSFLKIFLLAISFTLLGIYFSLNFSLKSNR